MDYQELSAEQPSYEAGPLTACLTRANISIRISRRNRTLQLLQNNTVRLTYPVAIGKHATPTPAGSFRIINKALHPGGPFGSRWLGLSINTQGSYGIHGTNNPASIGKAVSHGCIRMHNSHVESVFPLVSIGTTVLIAD